MTEFTLQYWFTVRSCVATTVSG